jgi:hypothetical protein
MLLTLVFARPSWQQVAKNEPTNDNSVLSEDHLTFVQDNVHQGNRMEVVNNHVISVIFPIDNVLMGGPRDNSNQHESARRSRRLENCLRKTSPLWQMFVAVEAVQLALPV